MVFQQQQQQQDVGGIIGAGLFFLFSDYQCHIKFLPLLILWNFVIECRHNSTNVVSQLSGNTRDVGKLCIWHTGKLMKGSWETETSTSCYYEP
jgi:hypothetical protein